MGPRTSRVHEILNVTHTWSDTSWLFWGWVRLISPNSTCRIDEKNYSAPSLTIFSESSRSLLDFACEVTQCFPLHGVEFSTNLVNRVSHTWGFFKRLRDWTRLGLNSLVCPSAEGNLIGVSQDHQAKLSDKIDLTRYWSWPNSHPPLFPKLQLPSWWI